MDEAIDQIFQGPQETYEELVEKFLFLSEDGPDRPKQNGYHHIDKEQQRNEIIDAQNAVDQKNTETEDIPTEELDAGFSLAASFDRVLKSEGAMIPKIGNYVDSDTSDLSSLSDCSDTDDWLIGNNFIQKDEEAIPEASHAEDSGKNENNGPQILKEQESEEDGFCVVVLNKVHSADPLPGEVNSDEQGSSLDSNIRITNLEIKTTIKTNKDQAQICNQGDDDYANQTSQIEEFKLDENFDYDNVELTPKNWSTE